MNRIRPAYVRMMEIVRALIALGGVGRPTSTVVAAELARRGALDPVTHFERFMGDVRPALSAIALLKAATSFGIDQGMLKPHGPRGRYVVTPAGKAAAAEYDSSPSPLESVDIANDDEVVTGRRLDVIDVPW